MRLIIEVTVKLLIYVLFFTGVYIIVRPNLHDLVRTYRHRARIKRLREAGAVSTDRPVERSALYRHIDMLLQSTWKYYTERTPANFIILTVSLFLSGFSVYARYAGRVLFSLACAVFTALIPYICLWLYLQIIRSQTSYQLVPAVSQLLGSYRVCSCNIYFAVIETIRKLDDNYLKKAFIALANKIQNRKNDRDIEDAVELFVFRIQTSWAKQLGVLLLDALVDGRNIEQSLSNIVADMKDGQNIIEEERSNSQETIYLGFLPLFLFPGSILFMQAMGGQFRLLTYQFATSAGLTSFLVALFLCFAAFVTALVLRKPKNDI